ncbi:MAG: hypothetical protein JO082_06925 [Mycobacterium sp.]|nr:hypothetical protein [Mycobacterium sp.]
MAASASLLKQLNSSAQLRAASPPRRASTGTERIAPYQLQVLAPNIADAVALVGGLIFDRATAGWDVTVVVDADASNGVDDRPIRILGGRVASAYRAERVPGPQLSVATDVFVKSWGRRQPPDLNCRFVPARHQPSAAAQVFKSHALVACGALGTQPTEEGFYSMT